MNSIKLLLFLLILPLALSVAASEENVTDTTDSGSGSEEVTTLPPDPCSDPLICPFGECSSNTETDLGYECICFPGYYKTENTEDCIQGLLFGGKLTFNDTYHDDANEEVSKYQDIINGIYENTTGYKNCTVTELNPGSVIVTYFLTYDSTGNEAAVKEGFYSVCNNTETTNIGDSEINCTASSNTFLDDDVTCSYYSCDSQTTDCHANKGQPFCECKEGYDSEVQIYTSCIEIICTSNSECNDPFGWCSGSATASLERYCTCMFGFSGSHCQESWEFVFTVVTAGLGVILIIVLIVLGCSCSKSQKASKNKTMQEDLNLKNPFTDFQPGLVRAKAPHENMYSISDRELNGRSSIDHRSHSNGAYSNLYDEPYPKPNTSNSDYQTTNYMTTPKKTNAAEYF